jgi:hypothetical protein
MSHHERKMSHHERKVPPGQMDRAIWLPFAAAAWKLGVRTIHNNLHAPILSSHEYLVVIG